MRTIRCNAKTLMMLVGAAALLSNPVYANSPYGNNNRPYGKINCGTAVNQSLAQINMAVLSGKKLCQGYTIESIAKELGGVCEANQGKVTTALPANLASRYVCNASAPHVGNRAPRSNR